MLSRIGQTLGTALFLGAIAAPVAAQPTLSLTAPPPCKPTQFGFALKAVPAGLLIGAPGSKTIPGRAFLVDPLFAETLLDLSSPAPAPGDLFGAALAALGPFIMVGAPGADGGGSVIVFDGDLQSPEFGGIALEIPNPYPRNGDFFGGALAAADGLLYVGAPYDHAGGLVAGSVYVCRLQPMTDTAAEPIAAIPNPSPLAGSCFGQALAAGGGTLLVGAPRAGFFGMNSGAAYLFGSDESGLGILRGEMIQAAPSRGGFFGESVARFGEGWLIGAPGAPEENGGIGMVSLFEDQSGDHEASLALLNPEASRAHFGTSLAVAGNLIAVGAEGNRGEGAAFLLARAQEKAPSSAP